MSEERIPVLHRAIAEAAVRAVLGDRAVIREMVEVPAESPLRTHITALGYGIRAFWNEWTDRHPHGTAAKHEA